MDGKSDSALVVETINGDVDSFTELCRRYYPAAVAIAHSILDDKHLAEDAAQEAFAIACRKLEQLKQPTRFPRWTAAICRNVALNMVRGQSRLYPAKDLSMVADRSPRAVCAADAVKDAIRKLPAAAKEVVFLRYYDGMTYEQMSSVLGISKQAINGRLRRAKKTIAKHLRRDSSIEVRL